MSSREPSVGYRGSPSVVTGLERDPFTTFTPARFLTVDVFFLDERFSSEANCEAHCPGFMCYMKISCGDSMTIGVHVNSCRALSYWSRTSIEGDQALQCSAGDRSKSYREDLGVDRWQSSCSDRFHVIQVVCREEVLHENVLSDPRSHHSFGFTLGCSTD